MTRRVAHVILLFVGLAPAVWSICVFPADSARAGVLATLAALGLVLNGVSLARRGFGMTVPLRVIACGVALAVVAGVMGMRQWLRHVYLPDLPESDAVGRGIALTASRNLMWIAAAVGYVILTILIMPVPPRKAPCPPDRSARIDFRTYGR